MTRRQILAVLGAGGLATTAYSLVGRSGGMVARGVAWPRGVTPVITPDGQHYQVSKNILFADPRIDAARWRLDVHGHVSRPLSLSLDDLRAMPAVEQPATLACIGNGIPARAIGTAVWKGVRVSSLLERTGAGNARDVVFIGADNYTDSIPIARALDPGTILAYEMNGSPVPRGHGAPLRAIVPGLYGMKNVKWVEAIELVDGEYLGYWQQRGWSETAIYRSLSRVDEPRHGDRLRAAESHLVAGMAFAGDRGVSRVEIVVNGAARVARLEPALGPHTWRIWTHDWSPPAPGEYELAVRVYDRGGVPQIETSEPSFPNGATGLHRVVVTVDE